MAKVIRFDTDRLNEDMVSISELIKSMRERVRNLENQITELEGMWTGPGSDAFKNALRSDLVGLVMVIENLEKLNGYEDKACGKFRRCEDKVSAAIDEIRV